MDDSERCYKLGVESLEARCIPSVSGGWLPYGLYPQPSGAVTATASTVGSNTFPHATRNALTASEAVTSFDPDDDDDGPGQVNLNQERGDSDDDAEPAAESAQLPAMTLSQNQAESGVGLVLLHSVPPTPAQSIGLESSAWLTAEIVSRTAGSPDQSALTGFNPVIAAHEKALEGLVFDNLRDLSVVLFRPHAHDQTGRWNSHISELIENFQDGIRSADLRLLRDWSDELFEVQTDVRDFIDNLTSRKLDDVGSSSGYGSIWLSAAVLLAVSAGAKGASELLKRQVGTTTWPSRHDDTLIRFVHCLCESGINTLTILEVGPGAATKLLAPYYPASNKGEKFPRLATHWRLLIRRLDSLLRRIPGIELCSFEPGELQCLLPAYVNHHVADISQQVIAAIQKQYPEVNARIHDFSRTPYPESVDAIVCLCVLVRAKKPKKLFEHLYKSLKPGGLLVMDNRSVRSFGGPEYPLESLSNQLFRKPANSKSCL